MDPVSAVGVAAAALQFGEITFKITKRIAVFTVLYDVPKHAEGPKAFAEGLRNQLGLIKGTISRIEEGLSNHKEAFQTNELVELSKHISNLNRHGKELDDRLEKYLPEEGASTPVRLLAALKSISADTKIKSTFDNINKLFAPLMAFLLTSMVFKAGPITGNIHSSTISGQPGQAHDAPSTIYQVSRHEVRYFVDRSTLLAEVDRIFDDESLRSPRVAILQGMGGQGKTQLALRHCGDARSRRKYDCTFWIDASTRASTLRGLEMISRELDDNNQLFPDTDARVMFVKRKLTAERPSWLLVFDNYDDPSAFDLRDYIPKGPLGHILITSRSTDVARLGPVINVSGMTEVEAIDLLFKQTDSVENATNQTAATEIVRRLGYLPLAVDQAAAYMKAEGLPLQNFLAHYEKSAKEVLESVPNLWEYTESVPSEDKERRNTMAKTVFTTWNLSFTSLRPTTSIGALKVTVLSLLAFFDGNSISEQYFEKYCSSSDPDQHPEWMRLFTNKEGRWSSKKFDDLMRELFRLSLITSLNTERKNTEFASISLHPLVRDWIHLRQEDKDHRENFVTFTQLLVHNIIPYCKEEVNSMNIIFLFPSFEFDLQLSTHTTSWTKIFGRHKADLNPTLIFLEQEDGKFATTTAEGLIMRYCARRDTREMMNEPIKWLWESCRDISDSRMLQAKLRAGAYRTYCLVAMELFNEAIGEARETLRYWESTLSSTNEYNDDILQMCRLPLGLTLSISGSAKYMLEAMNLFRSNLERLEETEHNLPRRHWHLAKLIGSAKFLCQYDTANKAFETMMDETKGGNSAEHRKRVWSFSCWLEIVAWTSYDRRNHEDLSQLALEWAMDMCPAGHRAILIFRTIRAIALAKEGAYSEAETIVRDAVLGDTHWISPLASTGASGLLGILLHVQKRYEEAYDVYRSVFLHIYSKDVGMAVGNFLIPCAETAKKFNVGLADVFYTFGLSYLKDTDDWVLIIMNIMGHVEVKRKIGTPQAARDILELLLEGLEIYGINVVYCEGSPQRKHRNETYATVNLERKRSLQEYMEDEAIRRALMEKIGTWYGFDLLLKLSMQLLKIGYKDAAEEAFRLAYTTFEVATGQYEDGIIDFIDGVFWYIELRFEVDKDGGKVRNMMDWAKKQIYSKAEKGMDGYESWWKEQTTDLLALLEPRPALRKTYRRLFDMVSRAKILKPPRPTSSQSDKSLWRGLRLAHDAVTSPVTTSLRI